jgi:ferredoxin
MLAAVEQACLPLPPGTLHVERFSPKEEIRTDGDTGFEVYLKQSGITVEVPPDRSILHSIEAAGVVVLSSCQEGTCGTCETDVLEGEPEHRDSLLTPEERASNETMMICVSRCKGQRLVLDL